MCFPKSIRERIEVLLVHRPHEHRYRFLNDLVFDFQQPDRALLSSVLVDPHPLDRRRDIALRLQAFIKVRQVGFQLLAIVLRGDPAQARGAVLAQSVVGFSKKVHIHTVDQGRKDPIRMFDRLLCNLPELR
jgi:hypothetical protein